MHLILIELRHKMFLRDRYKKRFNKNKNPEDWQTFKEYRNAVNKERPIRANSLLWHNGANHAIVSQEYFSDKHYMLAIVMSMTHAYGTAMQPLYIA